MNPKLQDIATKQEQVSAPYSQNAENVKPQENKTVSDDPKPVEQGQQATQQSSSDDLLSRVTKFVDDASPKNKSEDEIDVDIFNDAKFREKIDSIDDPELKQYMLSMRKTGLRGINDKLQEISEIRKEVQQLQQGNGKWTAERIQQALNDPEFLQAAQSLVGNDQQQFNDDDEYVSDGVKKIINSQQSEINDLKKQLGQFNQQQNLNQIKQEHESLRQKYGNYDPSQIDEIRSDLLSGKRKATNEDLYKVAYYETNIKNAYEMGRRDALNGVPEKVNASSFTGTVQQPTTEVKPENNETNKQFISRIINNKLSQLRK